ncbi:HD domain-containing protein [Desulfovibrio sp. OttesenSCG-928-C06]|nr:HD domain-containing protein [Desulfovibrio sp. OttesenSCG-928-C06]
MLDDGLKGIIAFLQGAENLKNTLRSAHTTTGRQESSAEHSWRLCLLAMLLGDRFEGVDREKMLRLCIVHDLAEAVCGDIPAPEQAGLSGLDGLSELPGPDDLPDLPGQSGLAAAMNGRGKEALERQAMQQLCAALQEPERAGILELWEEYEAMSTPEARIVKALDKLETLIQHNQGLNPDGFDYNFNLGYGQEHMDCHPLIRQIRDEVDRCTARNAARTAKPAGKAQS